MSIEFKNVAFSYDEHVIFTDLGFMCEPGECLAIRGNNGSGKSTMLKLAVGVLMPQSGEIYLNGENLWRKRKFRKPKVIENHASLIGYCMQKPERQLFAETVFEDVAFGPRNIGMTEEDVENSVDKWLNFFNISDLKDKSPYAISGGQKRMVALAGVLAMDAPNICMDEPSASLDDDGKELVVKLIRELKTQGKSVLLVTHSDEECKAVADSVLDLSNQPAIDRDLSRL